MLSFLNERIAWLNLDIEHIAQLLSPRYPFKFVNRMMVASYIGDVGKENFGFSLSESLVCCPFLPGFLGEKGSPYWWENWPSQWQNFRLHIFLFTTVVIPICSLTWSYVIQTLASVVWAFDTETECWSLMEAKGDTPVICLHYFENLATSCPFTNSIICGSICWDRHEC